MVTISNFSSLFEVAFFLNAVFFIFEFTPYFESMLKKYDDVYSELCKEKIEVTGSSETIPLELLLSSIYIVSKLVIGLLSLLFSITSIIFLINGAYDPTATISGQTMGWILFFLLGAIPIGIFLSWLAAYLSFRWAYREMDAEINEQRMKNIKK